MCVSSMRSGEVQERAAAILGPETRTSMAFTLWSSSSLFFLSFRLLLPRRPPLSSPQAFFVPTPPPCPLSSCSHPPHPFRPQSRPTWEGAAPVREDDEGVFSTSLRNTNTFLSGQNLVWRRQSKMLPQELILHSQPRQHGP